MQIKNCLDIVAFADIVAGYEPLSNCYKAANPVKIIQLKTRKTNLSIDQELVWKREYALQQAFV